MPGHRSFRELWDRMSPQSRVRAEIKTVRLEDLLATADPVQHRHPPMLEDAPVRREAGAAGVEGAEPVRDRWDRMSPQSRVRAEIKTVRLEDLLATADPVQHRHPPMLEDAPVRREAGAAGVEGAEPVRDRGMELDITDRDAVVHEICTHLRRDREPCLRCPEWEDSHRGRCQRGCYALAEELMNIARTGHPQRKRKDNADT